MKMRLIKYCDKIYITKSNYGVTIDFVQSEEEIATRVGMSEETFKELFKKLREELNETKR